MHRSFDWPGCRTTFLGTVLLLFVIHGNLLAAESDKLPNVVFIMTDNHGAWTLGCYGNPEIRTPHIDRLAAEGTLMEQAFSSNPVCSPTRATFLTGLMPSQHGVHCFLRGGRLQVGPEQRNTLAEFQSLGEILKSQGYRCGMVGKWHLGNNTQPNEGFDDYWITQPHGGTSTFYGAQVIEEGQIRNEPQYLTDFWTDHAVRFLEQSDDRPFFLFLPYNGPYALSRLLLREGQNRHAQFYRNRELTSFPLEAPHPWQYHNLDYFNQPIAHRRVATEVSGIDDGVGRVMQTLREQGLDNETLVIFTADQGWSGGHGGFFGMGDHTRPATATDRMMHIPMIFRHPGKIPAGQRSDLMVSNYDMLTTLIHYLGLEEHLLNNPPSPGRDFSPMLRGDTLADWQQEVFYEFEWLRTIRTDQWKLTRRHPAGPNELYSLVDDPEEQDNRFGRADVQEIQRQLQRRLDGFFQQFSQPQYDLLHGGGAQTVLYTKFPDLPPPTKRSPIPRPHDEHDRSQEIRVPEGYIVEKVAGSHLVQHPMMAGFDDQGRLYVAESAGLNLRNHDLEQQLPNSVKRLEDLDGDGIFDTVTTFADQMTLPMGALWYRGSLYVAAPPHVWRLEDTDDDGIADVRESLPARFGYNGNAASVHGCFLSPDGRIYWCDGRHGHELADERGQVKSVRKGSYIFSCLPDGSDIQVHCGGGMDNPVEVDFTQTGDVLGTVNILYSRPRIDCLVHWLHGGAYPHHSSVLGELPRTGDLLGPVHQFGHVAVSGTMRYRSGLLDRRFTDQMFVTIFNTGQVIRVELDKQGSTYTSRQHEFLTCSAPDFHPTDILEDADGSLLLVDTGGWFRIGCPTSQIAKPEIQGGIYRIRKQGMAQFVDPRGRRIDWPNLTTTELTRLLGDRRPLVAEKAIDACAVRGEAVIPHLKTILSRGDIEPRKAAAWALTRMRSSTAQAALRDALADRNPAVRQIAAHAAGVNRDADAVEALIALLHDPAPHVRRRAITSLGQIGDSAAVGPLLQHASHVIDRAEEHALIYALLEIQETAPLLACLESTSSSAAQVRTAMIALEQIEPQSINARQFLLQLQVVPEGQEEYLLQVVSRHPEWAAAVAHQVDQWMRGRSNLTPVIIQRLIQDFAPTQELSGVLQSALQQRSHDAFGLRLLFAGIQASSLSTIPPEWIEGYRAALDSENRQIQQAVVGGLVGLQHPFDEQLQDLIRDERTSDQLRLAAIEAGTMQTRTPAEFEWLLQLTATSHPNPLSERAWQLLAHSILTADQYASIGQLVTRSGPLQLQALFPLLQKANTREVQQQLAKSLLQARGRKSLAAAQLEQLSKAWDHSAVQLLQPMIEEVQQAEQSKLVKLDQMESLALGGSAARGREVFFSDKAKCATCHRIGGEGGQIGPDLSAIGRIRRERDLLEAILFPSSSFAREYEPYSVATSDGKVTSGLIVRETASTIAIQQATGDPVQILRDEIEQIVPSTVSIMPQGLETGLSEQQLVDLVAFLRSQTVQPE